MAAWLREEGGGGGGGGGRCYFNGSMNAVVVVH